MKINSINNINFGKKAIFNCTIKKTNDNKKYQATLYSFDPKNPDDMDEIDTTMKDCPLKRNFTDGRNYYSKYFVLMTDKTNEIISAAQTSEHYSRIGKYEGRYTSVDEVEHNKDFIDPMTPTLSHIAKEAMDRFSKHIITAFRTYEAPSLKNSKFTQNKNEVWFLPERRYHILIDTAEKRNQIDYIK